MFMHWTAEQHCCSANRIDKCVTIKKIVSKRSLWFRFKTTICCVCYVGMGASACLCVYVWFFFIASTAVRAFVEHMCFSHIWMIFKIHKYTPKIHLRSWQLQLSLSSSPKTKHKQEKLNRLLSSCSRTVEVQAYQERTIF